MVRKAYLYWRAADPDYPDLFDYNLRFHGASCPWDLPWEPNNPADALQWIAGTILSRTRSGSATGRSCTRSLYGLADASTVVRTGLAPDARPQSPVIVQAST